MKAMMAQPHAHLVCCVSAGKPALPEQVTRARSIKQAGLAISGTCLAGALLAAGQSNPHLLRSLQHFASVGVPALLGTAGVTLLTAKAVLRDALQLEWHNGRLHWELGAAVKQQHVIPDAIKVCSTPDRGNGAFAAQRIPAGTFIGDYEGEMLDEAAYWHRYPSGMADHCITVDQQWTLDGAARAQDTRAFSPCHMNHSATRYNVARHTLRRQRRVAFYTLRDVQEGEELLLNYGKTFWTDREDCVID